MKSNIKENSSDIVLLFDKNISKWIRKKRLLKNEVRDLIYNELDGAISFSGFKKELFEYCKVKNIQVTDKIVGIKNKTYRAYEFKKIYPNKNYNTDQELPISIKCKHCNSLNEIVIKY